MEKMTHAEWKAEGQRRFGIDPRAWRFVCPSCGHVASVQDWKDAGAPDGAVAFSCLGRYTGDNKAAADKAFKHAGGPCNYTGDNKAAADKAFKHAGGPCNYTGGGLFRLNPVEVDFEDGTEPMQAFAFAEVTPNT